MRSVTAFRPCWESRDLGFRILDVGFEELAVERFAQNSSSEISSPIFSMSLTDRTAAELLADLNARRVSSSEVTQAYIEQIEKFDGKVKAFLRYDGEAALAQARAIDERRAKNQPVGLLGWTAGCGQRFDLQQRRTDDLRLEDSGELSPAV